MSQDKPLGPVIHSFFADHLITVKGLRPSSVRSYRDTIRLLLTFAASDKSCKVTRLTLGDLTYDRIVRFLRHLEHDRGNHASTRNQRLAVLHTFFEYIAVRSPEMLAACQQVTAIPMKRTAPPETRFLERDEVEDLLKHMPRDGRHALRDRHCCCSSTTPAREPRKQPTCGPGTSTSACSRAPGCTARATSGGPARSGGRPPTFSPT